MDNLKSKMDAFAKLHKSCHDAEELKSAFYEIQREYEQTEKSPELRQAHTSLCLFYIKKLKKIKSESDSSLEWDIFEEWRILFETGELTSELENELFDAYRDGILTHTSDLARFAKRLFDNEDYPGAIRYYELFEKDMDNDNDWYHWSECYVKQDDYQQALTILQRAIVKLPDSLWTQCNIGAYTYNLGDTKKAIEEYDKVIKQAEKLKFTGNRYYNFAVRQKIICCKELDMKVQAFFEYSRLLSAGGDEQLKVNDEAIALLESIRKTPAEESV